MHERLVTPEAQLGAWYGRTRLDVGWTRSKRGPAAKKCSEKGPNAWKNAMPLPAEPGAAAGFFTTRLKTRNPVIPAVANRLILLDFDDGGFDELVSRYGLERLLPAGAWRVRTVEGTHVYLSAPTGRPGFKMELKPSRATFSIDGYLVGPGGTHPDGPEYQLENVDVATGNGRPPTASVELVERLLELGGQGRSCVAEIVESSDSIQVGDRHEALRFRAGQLRAQVLGAKGIRAGLEELAEQFAEPLEDPRELDRMVEWIVKKQAPSPLDAADVELLRLLEELPVRPAAAAGNRQVSRAEPWEKPVPLGDRLPVPSFPLRTLPRWQRDWVEALSNEKGASVDLAATLSLGAVAGGIARQVVVMPRRGWTEPTNLYLATALDPGQRKTLIFKAALRPVRALERKRMLAWEEQHKLAAITAAIFEKRRREVISESADDDELNPELLRERVEAITEGLGATELTPLPRLLTEDVTPEGLAVLLADHGRIIAASDEGAILFENFSGRYTQGSANWDLLNKAHSAGDLVSTASRARPCSSGTLH
jgi:hypothetical protein